AVALHGLVARPPMGQTVRAILPRPDAADPRLLWVDGAVLTAAALLVAPPLASLASGLAHVPLVLDGDFARALLTSLAIAVVSATASCLMAMALATAARDARLAQRRPRAAVVYDSIPALVLALPPFALTAGLFLLIRRVADPAAAGYALLPLMNALAALPFAYRFVAPAVMLAGERYGRLADLLGLEGASRVAVVDWPLLRRPLAAAFAMTAALSFGDFGVIALFGGHQLRTLPYLLYERLGAYRLEEASAVGLVLVLIALSLAYASSRWSDAPR
ncbi:MAG TPA: thiamine/thiamine pyrophosphate ABC transporter permease ThiP, partial [Microvirga sp.]|nr:thiamine/thiamine pyrophosphate ABC transporter permease ThiP [Microvirga sp.]